MPIRRFQTLVEWDPENKVWVTYVPALNHLSTYGSTEEEALERTREAILGYIEAAEKEGIPLPATELEPRIIPLEVPIP